jgi:hypothetical protein
MDCRLTIDKKTGFLKMLQEAFESRKPVNMLLDDDGLTRANGTITSLNTKNNTTIITLNDQTDISMDKLVAINGIFSDDFSEC